MNQSFGVAAAIAALVSANVSVASAATIIIDGFDVPQRVTAAAEGNPATDTVCDGGGSILGGCRHLQVETFNVDDPANPRQLGTSFNVEQSALDFENGPTSLGTGWIVYDGTEDRSGLPSPAVVAGLDFGATVNTTGLNADLLQGAPTGFFTFAAENFDQLQPNALTFRAFAWDLMGNTVSYFEEIDPLMFTPILPYDSFRSDWNDPTSGLDGFDFGQVGALAFRIDSTQVAFDGQITSITATPVPLPAAGFLLLGGLGGLAGLSVARQRRRAA